MNHSLVSTDVEQIVSGSNEQHARRNRHKRLRLAYKKLRRPKENYEEWLERTVENVSAIVAELERRRRNAT